MNMLRVLFFSAFCLLFFSCREAGEEHRLSLARIAAEINEHCPKMLDSETQLDGIEFREPNTLVYLYTLVRIPAGDVDTVAFHRALWPGVISHIRVSADMKKIRENNTHIEYVYRNKHQTRIYTLRIQPSDYQ